MKYTKSCTLNMKFAEPIDPVYLDLLSALPLEARITGITVRYKSISRKDMIAEFNARDLKRHDAAVKANITRKQKKGKAE